MEPTVRNGRLKGILFERWGTSRRAAKELEIPESVVSAVLNGHVRPGREYLKRFKKGLSPAQFREAFGVEE
jgi:hypothetical protein